MRAVEQTGLLERDKYLDDLREALADLAQGHGRLVLVAADAGGGKTALVQAFVADLPTGTSAFVGACDGLFTPRPLGAFADIAESIGGEVAELIERGARPYEVIGPLADKLSTRPTVLVLEDLHWADESTLDLLRLLARRAEGLGTLVIGTYRDDELGPAHPLRIVVGELKSTTSVLRLRLPALSPDAVHALAEPLGVDADALYVNTAGNPFFVTEAARRVAEKPYPRRFETRCSRALHRPAPPRPPPAGGRRYCITARGALAARAHCRRRARRARALPGVGDARGAQRRRSLPPRARALGDRGLDSAHAQSRASSSRAFGARVPVWRRHLGSISPGRRITRRLPGTLRPS